MYSYKEIHCYLRYRHGPHCHYSLPLSLSLISLSYSSTGAAVVTGRGVTEVVLRAERKGESAGRCEDEAEKGLGGRGENEVEEEMP